MSSKNYNSEAFAMLEKEEEGLNLKPYFFYILQHWYWLIIGLIIGVASMFLFLRYQTPIYRVTASILINDEENRGLFTTDIIADDLGLGNQSTVGNELRILKSSSLMRQVVDSLGLNIKYEAQGQIKATELYKDNREIILTQHTPEEKSFGKVLDIEIVNSSTFTLISENSDTIGLSFNEPFTIKGVTYNISPEKIKPGRRYKIRIQNPERTALFYSKQLRVRNEEETDVVDLTIQDPVPEKGIDILSTLKNVYNQSVIDEKKIIAPYIFQVFSFQKKESEKDIKSCLIMPISTVLKY